MSVYANASVSLDGYIAFPDDSVGPLFDWYGNGNTSLHTSSGTSMMQVTATSAAFVQPMWDSIGATIMGRRIFDLTDGWSGVPVAGDHVFVVSHRPEPDEWRARFPDAPFTFVGDVADAVGRARELAGDRNVSITPGEVLGQALAAGLVDEVFLDLAPVLLGEGKRYFGSFAGPHVLLENPEIVPGDRVTHLRYRVTR